MEEADDHIGNLDAGVVNVVLNVDLVAGGAEHAHKGVAEDGVAQVANVGGLVGIDACVLDEDVVAMRGRGRPRHSRPGGRRYRFGSDFADGGCAINVRIDVACAGDFKASKAGQMAEVGDDGNYDFLGDDFGGFAEGARQLEGDGCGQLAELELGRDFDGNGVEGERIFLVDQGAEMIRETLLEVEIHACVGLKIVDFQG